MKDKNAKKELDQTGWDKEVVALCNAINSIPGLETYESCCGHGKEAFQIWFKANDLKALIVLARAFDRRYGGLANWHCYLDMDDTEPVVFRIESESKGELAYAESEQVANNIKYWALRWECAEAGSFMIGDGCSAR